MSEPQPTVTYWAISIWNSRTFRVNAALLVVTVIPLLADPELILLIPPRYVVLYAVLVKVLNIYLRTITQRPVAILAPGDTAPVEVLKIDPPAPPGVTD